MKTPENTSGAKEPHVYTLHLPGSSIYSTRPVDAVLKSDYDALAERYRILRSFAREVDVQAARIQGGMDDGE